MDLNLAQSEELALVQVKRSALRSFKRMRETIARLVPLCPTQSLLQLQVRGKLPLRVKAIDNHQQLEISTVSRLSDLFKMPKALAMT